MSKQAGDFSNLWPSHNILTLIITMSLVSWTSWNSCTYLWELLNLQELLEFLNYPKTSGLPTLELPVISGPPGLLELLNYPETSGLPGLPVIPGLLGLLDLLSLLDFLNFPKIGVALRRIPAMCNFICIIRIEHLWHYYLDPFVPENEL